MVLNFFVVFIDGNHMYIATTLFTGIDKYFSKPELSHFRFKKPLNAYNYIALTKLKPKLKTSKNTSILVVLCRGSIPSPTKSTCGRNGSLILKYELLFTRVKWIIGRCVLYTLIMHV